MWRVLTIISKINKNAPIGFFDSGVGGLTVYSEFRKLLPGENCIYFGDTQNMPYGEKSKEQLIEYSKKAFDFFVSQNAKAVVMACNTTSATVYDVLKDSYPFRLYPVIQSVAEIIAMLPYKTIGVFATPATINSRAYSKSINSVNRDIKVIEIACPSWVKIVENNLETTTEALGEIKLKLDQMLSYNPEAIVLGCTHYPYLLPQLSKFVPENLFINPASAYADYIRRDLISLDLLSEQKNNGSEIFYVSSSPEKFKKASQMFYRIDAVPEILCL